MPSAPPGTCPICDYDLRGLPPAHRCPECNFAYDEFTRIWRWRNPTWARLKLALLAAILGGSVTVMFVFRTGWLGTFNVCCYGAVLAVYIVDALRLHPRRAFLAITPAGVLIRGTSTSTTRVEHQPWKDVGPFHIEERCLDVGLTDDLESDAGSFLNSYALKRFLTTPADAEEFAAALAAARARYTPESSPLTAQETSP